MAQGITRETYRTRESTETETKAQRIERAAVQPGGYRWPQLRIGRQADYMSMSQSVDDWNHFLNIAAAVNRRRGHGRTLSQLEIHIVSDREMRDMILAQTPNLARDHKKAQKRYDGIRRNLKSFVTGHEIFGHTLDLAELCERPDLMGRTHKLQATDLHSARSRPFRPTRITTRSIEQDGIIGYNGNVFGLNLSQNRSLYDERNDVLRFLHTEEGLDTQQFVRRDWEPHATIFEVSPHLRLEDMLMTWPSEIPMSIDLGPVEDLSQLS